MIEQKNKEIPQGHKLRNTITFFAGLAKVVIYLSIPALILMESPDARECFSGFKSHQQQRDHRPFISIFQIMQKSYFISRPVERPIESLHHIKVHLRPLDGGCKIVSVWMNTSRHLMMSAFHNRKCESHHFYKGICLRKKA